MKESLWFPKLIRPPFSRLKKTDFERNIRRDLLGNSSGTNHNIHLSNVVIYFFILRPHVK